MKKKTKIAITATFAVVLVAGILGVRFLSNQEIANTEQPSTENQEVSNESLVSIDIKTEREMVPEHKEVVDEETGEKVMAEVQINEPIEKKPTTPPEKPVSKGDYTNPEAPPTYTEEQTKVEQKKEPVKSSNSNSSDGKVYVEGFGYVEKAGQTKVQTGVSDGDINKMVGSMD